MGNAWRQPFEALLRTVVELPCQRDGKAAGWRRLGGHGRRRWESYLRDGLEQRQFRAIGFPPRRKGAALKNLAGALNTEAGGLHGLVDLEVKTENPVSE